MDHGVVVVGAGIGGVSVAAALRSHGYDGQVTLVDAGDFPHDRPPLSKAYLAGKASAADIALQPERWYDDHRVNLRCQSRVTALRCEGAVELDDGTMIAASRVVLATGATAARPTLPGIADDRIHVLRTVTDADRLAAALVPGARLLIVGAGLIGAEVASTAIDIGCAVTMVDPTETPLSQAFGADVADWLHGLATRRGVDVHAAAVHGFTPSPEGITATIGETSADFDAVLMAVGMRADTALAAAAGLRLDRGVVVDDAMVSSNSAILALGDAASPAGDFVGGRGHWETARMQADRVAATIVGQPVHARARLSPWFWTDRFGLHVEVVGEMCSGEGIVVRGTFGEPPFAVFALRGDKLVGAVGVDDNKSVRAAKRIIERNVSVDADALRDTARDLRSLLGR
ncbi:ferredoxin reductase [Mycolicibacterium mucogenicum]|uniref:Ferredoxin reductase n=1 Tax=Mycolicibacterium mucogenicum TaxID=56689 RepID=A0A1A3GQA1_MYCMU|nr:FAD-dependent oxidoreductase [Mycolicibacterium mucogenicum]OBJ37519.1 ferredoxin reductase [Mycolicibacterium mucogenicum]